MFQRSPGHKEWASCLLNFETGGRARGFKSPECNSHLMKEILRQFSHLAFGVAAAAAILILDRQLSLYLFSLVLFVGFVILDIFSRGYSPPVLGTIMKWVERSGDIPAKGALAYVVSIVICLVFFPTVFVAVAVLALGVYDSVSTVIGVRYGRNRIYKNKTLEGTGVAIIVTTLVLLLLIVPLFAVIITAATAVIELFSPIDDNLSIPIVLCLLLVVLV